MHTPPPSRCIMEPLCIESFNKNIGPHHGSKFQKRGIALSIDDELIPAEHVSASELTQFPLADVAKLPEDVQAAARYVALTPPSEARAEWKKALKYIEERAQELDDTRVHELLAKCHPELKDLTGRIHIPLLRELMQQTGMAGSAWVDQFYTGFPLIGTMGEEGVYPRTVDKEPTATREEVYATSKERFRCRASASASPFDIPLWEEALLQRDKGWLIGPYPIVNGQAVMDGTPKDVNFSFRFGVQQGNKLRAVDDLRQSRANEATSVQTPINLPTWDHFSALCCQVQELAPSAKLAMGKADHEDAYKHLPLRPEDRDLAAVTLRCHDDGKHYCFLSRTQLFGSTSAVLQYNCLSRVIATLAVRLLKIPVMGYYDDFGLIAPAELTGEALVCFVELNKLLGLRMKPSKTAWGLILEFLGVTVDFSRTPHHPPILKLSEERKAKLTLLLRETLAEERTTRAKLQKLTGKLNFAHTAVLGKYAGATCRPLYALASANSEATKLYLNEDAVNAIRWWIGALRTMAPRLIERPRRYTDVRVYSDAEGSGGCAALIYESGSSRPILLSESVDSKHVEYISTQTSAIYILEMYAMVAAVISIKPTKPLNLLLFMDNDAAAQALINGSARDRTALLLIKLFWNHIASFHLCVWIERVPSASNPADAPSRGRSPYIKPQKHNKMKSLKSLLLHAESILSLN